MPLGLLYFCDNLEKIYATEESLKLSPNFAKYYKDKIELIKSLDDLLNEGKSLKEISKIFKTEDIEMY